MRESTIYASGDINKIQGILEHLQNLRDVERMKYKADSLQRSGEYETAILVYQSIINSEWDNSVSKLFYGRVYASLGAAYGQRFLYEEAARVYLEAYRICGDMELLRTYLYCCYRALPEDQYVKMLSGNSTFLNMDSAMKEDIREIQRGIDVDIPEEQFEQWKKEYRKINKSRIAG